jgi:hypothetical protein
VTRFRTTLIDEITIMLNKKENQHYVLQSVWPKQQWFKRRQWPERSTIPLIHPPSSSICILYHFDQVFTGCDAWGSWIHRCTVHKQMWCVTLPKNVHTYHHSSQTIGRFWHGGCRAE